MKRKNIESIFLFSIPSYCLECYNWKQNLHIAVSNTIIFREKRMLTASSPYLRLKNERFLRLKKLSTSNLMDELIFLAFPLLGWNVTYENKTSSSLQLRWMDISNWLSGGVRFFVVIANSRYNNVPIRKLVPPNITSAEITGLDPYREYNMSVMAIDGYGSPFRSAVLQAKTNEGGE